MPFSTGEQNLLQLNQSDFDFNIQFEQLFFSIIPSTIFILASLCTIVYQSRRPTVVGAPTFGLIKLGTLAVYFGLEIALLIIVSIGSFHVTSIFLASAALRLISALLMIILSFVDHRKSLRPSVLLNSYLFLTLLLDIVQARTLFLSSDNKPELTYSGLFVAALALKTGILLLEAQRKSELPREDKKERSPEETSGIFSLSVFFWLNKIFFDGYKKVLSIEDLYPLDSALDARPLHDNFSDRMEYSKLKGDRYGLVKVLIRTLKAHLLLPILPRLALLGFTFCQPFFIERLLNYLSEPRLDANAGYGFIGASILIYGGIALSTALYWYFHLRMLTMARSILVTETFSQATKARLGVTDTTAAVTLMSTDIERINMGFRMLHEIWASLIQVALASWLLYTQLGVVFVAPIGLAIACFVGLAVLMKFTGDSQRQWMAEVQKRVGLTATVIANMKSLKMSGLSVVVGDFVQALRVKELAAGSRYRKIVIIAALFGFTPLLIGPPITFAAAQKTLTTSTMFTSLSYLLLLTNPLTQVFQSIPQVLSGLACLGRIQAFLECETREDFRKILVDLNRDPEKLQYDAKKSSESDRDSSSPIVIKDGSFGWKSDGYVLQSINLELEKSSLTIVVGPVGSGKSTLCKSLIGEIPFNEGTVSISTRLPHVGYCDQTAFLSNASIRANIVGFSNFDPNRYDEVIEATALVYDLDTLPQGDLTNVGSDGITLSGGQKQRVSLARALYLQADLLILDDVFSGLDANTEDQVFRRVFGPEGLLRNRRSTVLLCTHSVKHLPAADHVVALENGTIAEQGTLDELMNHEGYIQRLGLKVESGSDSSSERSPKIIIEEIIPELVSKTKPETLTTASVKDESRQVGDKTVYLHYLKSMGWVSAGLSLLFSSLWGLFTNYPNIWLKYWSENASSDQPAHSFGYYAGIYSLLQVCGILSLLFLAIVLLLVSVRRAGANLHQKAVHTVIRAPLLFFTQTDTGVITNLFSQDLNLIDTELPNALLNTLVCVFEAVGQAAVLVTSSPYLAISYPFLGFLLYVLQRFYLRTSRQLRLLDLEAKSPLYTHFLDTVKGIATLRAFGFMTEDIDKNVALINSSQRPAYLLAMIQQWLTLFLDIVVMIMAAVMTTLAVRLHSNSGFAGASLVTLMNFGVTLSGIVISYTKLETSIGAIARLNSFNKDVEPEDREDENIIPPKEWPERGVIELNGVSASYSSGKVTEEKPSLALRDINFNIKAGEKVAVCGRTGSGKSSFIALLLKLLDPISETAQSILIDNTPLHSIDRSTLRQRIIAVPQEAVFLPDGASFKTNLDPSKESSLDDCKDVLIAVGLWDFVQKQGGLEGGMKSDSLSAGQRQLLSLGRALLRRRVRARSRGIDINYPEGGVLLLDEVSSNVDSKTEKVMQEIISNEFKNYTIVAVSHRLDMIMDFDRVVVMDTGEIVEVGNPTVLASEEGSRFGDLVHAGAN